jgi:Ankyrin repeats (3 copies)
MRATVSALLLSVLVLAVTSCSQRNNLAVKAMLLEKQHPMAFFEAAGTEYRAGRKSDAAFLFYLGQLRSRYYLAATNADGGDRETFGAVQAILGEAINTDLNQNLPAWIAVIDRVIDWDAQHDYEFYSKNKAPKQYRGILDGLISLRTRLAKIQALHRNPADFAYGPGYRFSLFDSTHLKPLADAVEFEDTDAIAGFTKRNDADVDYAERNYGNTLLMLAIQDKRPASVRALLRAGANPNKFNATHDENPMTLACDNRNDNCDTRILAELLRHGGNPNTPQMSGHNSTSGEQEKVSATLLMLACQSGCLSRVKLLVEAGADINKRAVYPGGALTAAAYSGNPAIVRYLVIDRKASIPEYCVDDTVDGVRYAKTLSELLQRDEYDQPEQVEIKKEVLDYLAHKGLK